MVDVSRYAPLALASVALVACLLPFGSSGNLLTAPDAFAEAGNFMGMLNGPPRPGQPGLDPSLAVWIARLVYLAPLAAIGIIVLNIRGHVQRSLQIVAAAIWIGSITVVPYAAGAVFLAANPALKQLAGAFGQSGSISLDFGIGAWLLILASIGMALNAFDVLKKVQARPAA